MKGTAVDTKPLSNGWWYFYEEVLFHVRNTLGGVDIPCDTKLAIYRNIDSECRWNNHGFLTSRKSIENPAIAHIFSFNFFMIFRWNIFGWNHFHMKIYIYIYTRCSYIMEYFFHISIKYSHLSSNKSIHTNLFTVNSTTKL